MCQNEGTRNDDTCMCDCADGFSGDNCESKSICNVYSTVGRSIADIYIRPEATCLLRHVVPQ